MNKHMHLSKLALLPLLVSLGCVDPNAEQKAVRPASTRLAASPTLEFTCDLSAVTAETLLRPVVGAEGETLTLDPSGEPCRYHLLYKDAHRGRRRLSDDPEMHIVTYAQRFPGSGNTQTTVVCSSPIRHRKSRTPALDASIANRTIHGVQLACAADRGSGFTELEKLVDGGKDYAAWIVSVAATTLPAKAKGDDGKDRDGDDREAADLRAFAATWVRDSTFQFFNLEDAGRPPTDGIYQTVFTVDTEGKVRAGATTKLSSTISSVHVTAG